MVREDIPCPPDLIARVARFLYTRAMMNPAGLSTHAIRILGVVVLMLQSSSCGDRDDYEDAQEWDGSIHWSGKTKDGRKHGPWIAVENGEIVEILHWRDGVLHGPRRWWYREKNMYSDSNYDNGVLHGRRRFFYAPGRLGELVWYDRGKKVRTWCSWEPDGSLEYIREYQFDKLRREELRPPGECPVIFDDGARHLDQDDLDFR